MPRWLKRFFCPHTWRPANIFYMSRIMLDPIYPAVDERDAWKHPFEPVKYSCCIRCGKHIKHYGPLISFEEHYP